MNDAITGVDLPGSSSEGTMRMCTLVLLKRTIILFSILYIMNISLCDQENIHHVVSPSYKSV